MYIYYATENKENHQHGSTVTPTVLSYNRRLPDPCPLPTTFSKKVSKALESGPLAGNEKLMFLREVFTFYYGVCPNPLPCEYDKISEALCLKYPELQDKLPVDQGKPWVSYIIFIDHSCVLIHNQSCRHEVGLTCKHVKGCNT